MKGIEGRNFGFERSDCIIWRRALTYYVAATEAKDYFWADLEK